MASDPSDNGLNAGLAQTAYPEVAPGQWNSAAQAWQLPPAETTVVRPSQPLSDDRLFDLGVISPEEYQRRTGRLSPYTGLQSGLFPRAQAALNNDSPYLQQAVGAGMDLASLPGRAYASLGSLPNESYGQALARVSSPDSAEKAYQITDNMFRDPSTALIPLGLGLAGKLPAVASGIEALGTAGRVGLDAAANTAAQMGNEYGTTGTTSNPLGSGLMNAAMDVGVRGMGGLGSKLARMVSPEESAANFKRWFGDSKVLDEAGKPLVVYHGTRGDFDAFDPSLSGSKSKTGAPEGSFFFSDKPDVASSYTVSYQGDFGQTLYPGANVVPANIAIKKPLRVNAKGDNWRDIQYKGEFLDINEIVERAKESGKYDGVIVKNVRDKGVGNVESKTSTTIVPFDPTQIKSAIGNRGTWDPSDPNITHFAPGLSAGAFPNFATLLANRVNNTARQAAMQQGQQTFGGQQ